jgi:hypothetical protein
MKLNDFEVVIPEGDETEVGYVCLKHGTQYSIKLRNHSERLLCNATVEIDGRSVGTWRVDQGDTITIERPVHDSGRFTFYQEGTPEATKANIRLTDELGLISVLFRPEKRKDVPSIQCMAAPRQYMAAPRPYAAGGTGLSGKSAQQFDEAEEIEIDDETSVTIHLRLVAIQNEPRPLFARESHVPPAVQTKTEDFSNNDGCSPSLQRQSRNSHVSTLTALGACMLILSFAYLLMPMWKTNDHVVIEADSARKTSTQLPPVQNEGPLVDSLFGNEKLADKWMPGKSIDSIAREGERKKGLERLLKNFDENARKKEAAASQPKQSSILSNLQVQIVPPTPPAQATPGLRIEPAPTNASASHRALQDWSSSDGKVIHAYFIDLQVNGVLLDVPSTGIKHVVPLSRLSAQSQEQAKANKVAMDKLSKLEMKSNGSQAAGLATSKAFGGAVSLPPPPKPEQMTHLPTDQRLSSGALLVDRLAGRNRYGELEVVNGLSEDALVKLISNERLAVSFYVRGGETFKLTSIPDGNYSLLYCIGFGWSQQKRDFSRGRHASRHDKTLQFTTQERVEGRQIITSTSVISLTLHKVVSGNTTTSEVSLEEFDKYN